MQSYFLIATAFTLLLVSGCGGGPRVVKVGGVVTLDGRPLERAAIAFQPIATSADDIHPGAGSFAHTDAAGKFQLELVDPPVPGAVVGKHRVTIVSDTPIAPMDDSGRIPPDPIPTKYRDGSLEFIVPPEGTTSADFHIHSEKGPPRR